MWVSEIMLQQTQVKTVIGYYERWMRVLPDIASLWRADSQTLHKLWEGLGYYTRVRNMHRAAREIVEKHGGRFPSDYDQVLDLPGIGRYTAGAICSIAYGQATPILDGNVIRVLSRVYGVGGDVSEKAVSERLWGLSQQLVLAAAGLPPKDVRSPGSSKRPPTLAGASPCSLLNQSLMELGALVCTPKNPRCDVCPVKRCCVALSTQRVDRLPTPRKRPSVVARRFAAFVLRKGGKYWVCQRPAGVVNSHLWEFPNLEVKNGEGVELAMKRLLGREPGSISLICVIRHSITRYRISLEVYECAMPQRGLQTLVRDCKGRWFGFAEMAELPFTSAHRKAIGKLKQSVQGGRSFGA